MKQYNDFLADWVAFSQKHIHTLPDRPEFSSYGTGYNGWGNQTNQKGFSAFAIAALDDSIDWKKRGLTKETVLNEALQMLRFCLASHIEGDYTCTDGEKWGHTWISGLGTERMMHAVEALWDFLTAEDHLLLRKVLLSEADWLLTEYPVEAGLVKNNKPESNIWNGSVLLRCALYYPDCDNAAKYTEKGIQFLVNGISTESDETSTELVDGYLVKDLFIGANFYDSYACNHHGYLNVGYMVICMSNIAMLHFSYKARNKAAPEALYRHAYDLWKLIRTCTFPDGRLLRIGGDSRARYCYCQDFALPMWALMSDYFGEDCSFFLNGWEKLLEVETTANGDGSFLSNRVGYMEALSPIYYTRLESDRANVISMYLYWNKLYAIHGSNQRNEFSAWHDDYHGGTLVKGKKRTVSFVWRASELPQALVLPANKSDIAEWRYNLTGSVKGIGAINNTAVASHHTETFDGGFLTYGEISCSSEKFVAEQQQLDRLATKYIAFAALPDDETILCIQVAKAKNYTLLKSMKSILWNVPNDIFNGNQREYFFKSKKKLFAGGERKAKEEIPVGTYLNVDHCIGIASLENLTLIRPEKRQVEIKRYTHYDFTDYHEGTLYCDEIVGNYNLTPTWTERDDIIFDTSFAMNIGGEEQTKQLSEKLVTLPHLPEMVKSISVVGDDNKCYTLIYNLSENDIEVNKTVIAKGEAKLIIAGKENN